MEACDSASELSMYCRYFLLENNWIYYLLSLTKVIRECRADVHVTNASSVYHIRCMFPLPFNHANTLIQKERGHFKGCSDRQTMVHFWTVESVPVAPWWAGCSTLLVEQTSESPSPGVQHGSESHFILCLLRNSRRPTVWRLVKSHYSNLVIKITCVLMLFWFLSFTVYPQV